MSEFLNKNIDLRDSIVEMIAVFGLVFFGLGAVALGSFYSKNEYSQNLQTLL